MEPRTKEQFFALVCSTSSREKNQLAKMICDSLSAIDIDELTHLTLSGTDDEKDGAIRVLNQLNDLTPGKITYEQRARWLINLEKIVEDCYPSSVLGTLSFVTLLGQDRSRAERFLLDELSLEERTDAELEKIVDHLAHFRGNPDAVARLEAIRRTPGAAGAAAIRVLERMGVLSQERLEELAKAWREQRSPNALSDFYYKYIANIPAGDFPLAKITAMLGPPTGRSGNAVWYEASRGTALYLEADEKGNLKAFRLS